MPVGQGDSFWKRVMTALHWRNFGDQKGGWWRRENVVSPVQNAVRQHNVRIHLCAFFLCVLCVDQPIHGGDELRAPCGKTFVDLLRFSLESAFLFGVAEVEWLLQEAVDVP